jgi:hypothetical protein
MFLDISARSMEPVLLASILFVVFEALQGNGITALCISRAGLESPKVCTGNPFTSVQFCHRAQSYMVWWGLWSPTKITQTWTIAVPVPKGIDVF